MSHDHTRTLNHIFAHPVSMNIKWNEVTHLIASLGGTVESAHGGREKIRLNGQERTFHVPHSKAIDSKDEVVQLRKFLELAGVAPKA